MKLSPLVKSLIFDSSKDTLIGKGEQCDFVRRLKKSAMPSAGVAIAKNYI
jgi:hypothetical protein